MSVSSQNVKVDYLYIVNIPRQKDENTIIKFKEEGCRNLAIFLQNIQGNTFTYLLSLIKFYSSGREKENFLYPSRFFWPV